MGKFGKEFAKGIIITNPVFVLVLGLCPTLAISTSIDNALGMTLAVLIVLLGSNILIAAIRNYVPNITRIPIFIVIIATLVTVVNLIFHAYLPATYEALGIYLPLVVVNCIILGRAEAFASKHTVAQSIADALGMTVGFMLALLMISFIRQVLGTGSLSVFGAFIVIGLLMGLFRRTGVMKE
jgi:electron transport complex protein RnfE